MGCDGTNVSSNPRENVCPEQVITSLLSVLLALILIGLFIFVYKPQKRPVQLTNSLRVHNRSHSKGEYSSVDERKRSRYKQPEES